MNNCHLKSQNSKKTVVKCFLLIVYPSNVKNSKIGLVEYALLENGDIIRNKKLNGNFPNKYFRIILRKNVVY